MSEDTKLKELIINTLSPEQMPEVLSDTEIYLVEDDAEYATVEELTTKQDVINDLDTIRDGASKGATAYTTIQGYGDIVTHNAIEFALKSEIPDVSKYALDSGVVHKDGVENISGVKTFTGGSGGNNVAIKAPNGMSIGSTTQTAYSQYATIRLVNGKVNTGSYYIDGNSSVLFRHKTGTTTAEGTANDAMFTINPETGIKAGWSGTAGVGITDADLHDVLIDTIEYSKLTTTAKDVLGAINELNAKPSAPDLDNKTISKNASNELQAIALIDNNNNAIKTWTGTKAEYEAITTKDNNTLYNITDDSDINITLLELLFPVGAIYQGTMGVCPLQVLMPNTQWELVASDRVLQGAGSRGTVGTTIDESLPNVTGYMGDSSNSVWGTFNAGGAFAVTSGVSNRGGTGSSATRNVTFDASKSNPTYQDNAPVQQDAYIVNIWERVA